ADGLAGVEIGEVRVAIEFVRQAARAGRITAAHDVSDGGIACALAEMAITAGAGVRADLDPLVELRGSSGETALFGEGPGGFVVAGPEEVIRDLGAQGERAGVALQRIGDVGGEEIELREAGLASQVFDEEKRRALDGDMAIGHVRYSTTGGRSWENSQPVWRDDGREVALAHNGNLTNAVELYNELRDRGLRFRGTSDSEIMAALLSVEDARPIENAVQAVMPRLEGAYSTVVMTKRAVVAFRDPH